MSHWAELDKDNIVLRVTVGNNNDPAGDEGHSWLVNNLGGTWIKTSYNSKIRGKYAGIGDTYDSVKDIFVVPKPFPSWIQDGSYWKAPVDMPTDGKPYSWDEPTLSWKVIELPS
jgi:hypothetical protein